VVKIFKPKKLNFMRNYFISSAIALVAILFLSGCATVIHGSKQQIAITSNPSSGTVTVDDQVVGKTPFTTRLSRKKPHFIKIELDGYFPYQAVFTRKTSGWIAGNILIGGLIGLGVDAITGGMYKLSPEAVQAELRNEQRTGIKLSNDQIFLTIALEPKPGWEKIGQLVVVNQKK